MSKERERAVQCSAGVSSSNDYDLLPCNASLGDPKPFRTHFGGNLKAGIGREHFFCRSDRGDTPKSVIAEVGRRVVKDANSFLQFFSSSRHQFFLAQRTHDERNRRVAVPSSVIEPRLVRRLRRSFRG